MIQAEHACRQAQHHRNPFLGQCDWLQFIRVEYTYYAISILRDLLLYPDADGTSTHLDHVETLTPHAPDGINVGQQQRDCDYE